MTNKIQLTLEDITLYGGQHYFSIPLPKQAIEGDVQLNENLAWDILDDVANNWQQQMCRYVFQLPLSRERKLLQELYFHPPTPKQQQFWKGKRSDRIDFARKYLGDVYVPREWEFEVDLSEKGNGFTYALSLGREYGTLIAKEGVTNPFNKNDIAQEKLQLLGGQNPQETIAQTHVILPVYSEQNVKDVGTALFLKNWGLTYINKILEQMQE